MSPQWKRTKLYTLSWASFNFCIKNIQIALAQYKPELIVAIARGGLIPGAALSHIAETPQMMVIEITRNLADTPYFARFPAELPASLSLSNVFGKDILLVDDIVGDGDTMLTAYQAIREAGAKSIKTTSLVCNTGSHFVPDIFLFGVDDWVIFPWEKQPNWADIRKMPLIPSNAKIKTSPKPP